MGVRQFGEDEFRALLEALENAGGELPAVKVREYLAIEDKSNLSRAAKRPIELGLIHRVDRGPNTVYRLGPDPSLGAGEFNPVLHGDDGMLVLYGIERVTDDEHEAPVLNRAQVLRLKRMLNGEL